MTNLDNPEMISEHKEFIYNKKPLRNVYILFYKKLLLPFKRNDKILEIGSGGGFLRKYHKKTITSDVVKGNGIDKVFFAEKIPLRSSSLDGIVMLNVFHHIKNINLAIIEMCRVLKVSGKIVMIEPWNSSWGRIIYTNFHHEDFNPKQLGWKVKGNGRMSDANGALPWIVFKRDIKKFSTKFPQLSVIKVEAHTPLSYLLTGGLTKPSIVPAFSIKYIARVESVLCKLFPFFSMFVTIEIQKINSSRAGR